MEFCPTCGMLLQYQQPYLNRTTQFTCPTCAYVSHLESKVKIKKRQHLVRKEIDPIFSKDDMKKSLLQMQHAQTAHMEGLFSSNFRSGQPTSQCRHSIGV